MFWLNHIIYILEPDKKEYMIYKVLKGMTSLPLGFFGRLVSQVIAQIYLLIKLLRSSHCIAFWCMIWPIPNYATLYLRRLSLAFVRSLIQSPSQLDTSCVVPVVRNGKPSFFFFSPSLLWHLWHFSQSSSFIDENSKNFPQLFVSAVPNTWEFSAPQHCRGLWILITCMILVCQLPFPLEQEA